MRLRPPPIWRAQQLAEEARQLIVDHYAKAASSIAETLVRLAAIDSEVSALNALLPGDPAMAQIEAFRGHRVVLRASPRKAPTFGQRDVDLRQSTSYTRGTDAKSHRLRFLTYRLASSGRQNYLDPRSTATPFRDRLHLKGRSSIVSGPCAGWGGGLILMIRIAISAAAFEAIARTLPLGSVGYEAEANEQGERLIWLEAAMADRLGAMRGPGRVTAP